MKRVVISVVAVIGVIAVVYFSMFADEVDTSIAAEGTDHVISMSFNEDDGTVFFAPDVLLIRSGDTVTWIQEDEFNEHNVVSYPDGIPAGTELFEGPLLNALGQTYSLRFTEPGTYRYHCHPHEEVGMKGVIIVDRESLPGEFRVADPDEVHEHGGTMEMPDQEDMSDHDSLMRQPDENADHEHSDGDEHG